MSARIRLLSKPGCHLCDDARAVVEAVCVDTGEAYDEVDELVGYFRQAAADATRLEGSLPPSVDAAKRNRGAGRPKRKPGSPKRKPARRKPASRAKTAKR